MGAGIAGLGFEKLVYGGLTKVFAGIVIAPIGGIIFGLIDNNFDYYNICKS